MNFEASFYTFYRRWKKKKKKKKKKKHLNSKEFSLFEKNTQPDHVPDSLCRLKKL